MSECERAKARRIDRATVYQGCHGNDPMTILAGLFLVVAALSRALLILVPFLLLH